MEWYVESQSSTITVRQSIQAPHWAMTYGDLPTMPRAGHVSRQALQGRGLVLLPSPRSIHGWPAYRCIDIVEACD